MTNSTVNSNLICDFSLSRVREEEGAEEGEMQKLTINEGNLFATDVYLCSF